MAVQGAAKDPEFEIRRCHPGIVAVRGVGLVGDDAIDLVHVHPRRGQVEEVVVIIIESGISLFLSVCFLYCSSLRLLGKCFKAKVLA